MGLLRPQVRIGSMSHPLSPPRLCRWLNVLLGAAMLLLASHAGAKSTAPVDPAQMAFLGNSEEQTFSEILQKNQRILLQIELVDMVRPKQRKTIDKMAGYLVPPGDRRVQFRV